MLQGFNVKVLEERVWTDLSKNVSVICEYLYNFNNQNK